MKATQGAPRVRPAAKIGLRAVVLHPVYVRTELKRMSPLGENKIVITLERVISRECVIESSGPGTQARKTGYGYAPNGLPRNIPQTDVIDCRVINLGNLRALIQAAGKSKASDIHHGRVERPRIFHAHSLAVGQGGIELILE